MSTTALTPLVTAGDMTKRHASALCLLAMPKNQPAREQSGPVPLFEFGRIPQAPTQDEGSCSSQKSARLGFFPEPSEESEHDETEVSKYLRGRIEACFRRKDNEPLLKRWTRRTVQQMASGELKMEIRGMKETWELQKLLELAEDKELLKYARKYKAPPKVRSKLGLATSGTPKARPQLLSAPTTSRALYSLSLQRTQAGCTRRRKRLHKGGVEETRGDLRECETILPISRPRVESLRDALLVRIPDQRAIAMANRIHCTEDEKKESVYSMSHKKLMQRALEKNLMDEVQKAKKDHLARMYTQYMDMYKNTRQDLAENATTIFNNEMLSINSVLSAPSSPKKNPVRCVRLRKNDESSGRRYHGPRKKPEESPVFIQSLQRATMSGWETQRFFSSMPGKAGKKAPRRRVSSTEDEEYKAESHKRLADIRYKTSIEKGKKIEERILRANTMRELVMSQRKERAHVDHSGRLLDIKKKEDEIWRSIETLETARESQRDEKISNAIRLKFGRIKKKIQS